MIQCISYHLVLVNQVNHVKQVNQLNQVKQVQAGAELCQAQEKLGLAKPALPSKKLRWSYINLNMYVISNLH